MSGEHAELSGPDFTLGFRRSEVPDGGMVAGHAHGKAVLVARQADEVFAIGAHCTHYAGPLADGLLVGDTVRCPWHHACFSLRTGEALRRLPCPVARWRSSSTTGCVRDRRDRPAPAVGARPRLTGRIVRRRRWSSSAPAPPGRRGGDAAARGLRGAAHADRRRETARTTGRTSRRTTWPVPRQRSGSRCVPRRSTRSRGSTWSWAGG